MKVSVLFSCLVFLSACAPVKTYVPPVAVDEQFLQGTWLVLNRPDQKEIFLPSYGYCAHENSKHPKVSDIGTWSISQPGYVYVKITDSTNPNHIVSGDVAEIRIVERIGPNKLLMGYSCPHCEGGIAGLVYVRATTQVHVCDKVSRDSP